MSSQTAEQRNNLTHSLEQGLGSLLDSTLFLARGASLVSQPEKSFAALLFHMAGKEMQGGGLMNEPALMGLETTKELCSFGLQPKLLFP